MPYKQADTHCVVRLVALRGLTVATLAQCQALRAEAGRLGINVEWIDEAYSTKTCSHCGRQHASSPRGRRFGCSGCGMSIHQDVNAANNICSKAAHGRYAQVQVDTVKYLRPIGVAPLTRAISG
jgi:hypothetical protein